MLANQFDLDDVQAKGIEFIITEKLDVDKLINFRWISKDLLKAMCKAIKKAHAEKLIQESEFVKSCSELDTYIKYV